jgi:hypothetical protein
MPRLTIPGGLTLTQVSGGTIDISNAADGSDNILDIFVSTYPTEDLLGGETVTWVTSDAVFAQLIARTINKHAAEHHYWATAAAAVVYIWPQDGTAADTGSITGDDVSFTATFVAMNTAQAFVAAINWDSGNYGQDIFASTAIFQIGFDLTELRSLNTDWDLTTAKAMRLTITAEDQIVRVFCGARGQIAIPASDATTDIEGKRSIHVLGAMDGHIKYFIQAAAASNPTYEIDLW